MGLGSANPRTEEPFGESTHNTFHGRALAVVRPTAPGTVTVTVAASGLAPRHVTIERSRQRRRKRDFPMMSTHTSRPPSPAAALTDRTLDFVDRSCRPTRQRRCHQPLRSPQRFETASFLRVDAGHRNSGVGQVERWHVCDHRARGCTRWPPLRPMHLAGLAFEPRSIKMAANRRTSTDRGHRFENVKRAAHLVGSPPPRDVPGSRRMAWLREPRPVTGRG